MNGIALGLMIAGVLCAIPGGIGAFRFSTDISAKGAGLYTGSLVLMFMGAFYVVVGAAFMGGGS